MESPQNMVNPETISETKKMTVKEAWAKRRDEVNPFFWPSSPWGTSEAAPYKERQRLRPLKRLIAVSERLREYQKTYGASAVSVLKQLKAEAADEPVPWREHRVQAWSGVMSDRGITLKERADAHSTVR